MPAITWKDFITHSETSHAVAFNQLEEKKSTDSIWDRIVNAFSNRNSASQSSGGAPVSDDLKIPEKKDSFDYLEKQRQMP